MRRNARGIKKKREKYRIEKTAYAKFADRNPQKCLYVTVEHRNPSKQVFPHTSNVTTDFHLLQLELTRVLDIGTGFDLLFILVL